MEVVLDKFKRYRRSGGCPRPAWTPFAGVRGLRDAWEECMDTTAIHDKFMKAYYSVDVDLLAVPVDSAVRCDMKLYCR
jgi:hypothetical protein